MNFGPEAEPLFERNADLDALKEGETLDGLLRNKVKVIQARKGYRVSEDAVILSWFATKPAGAVILDAGAGCGAIGFALAVTQPHAKVVALEIQRDLCDRAARGRRVNRLEARVTVVRGDLRTAKTLFRPAVFDVVASNPPYRAPGTGRLSKDSEKAVARHQVMMPLRTLFEASAHVLKPQGVLCLIYPAEGLPAAGGVARECGFSLSRVLRVHSRQGALPSLVCVEAILGPPSGDLKEDDLFLYDETGRRTARAEAVLNGEQPE
jgi:tRNA1Val (adenine37-N6)-methyltransferase